VRISAKAGKRVYELVVERRDGKSLVEVDGERRIVDAQKLEGDFYTLLSDGRSYEVSVEPKGDGYQVRHGAAVQIVTLSDPGRQAREARPAAAGPQPVVSVMPGKVARVLVSAGEAVAEGQGVVVVEAMKMENEIVAGKAGRVSSVKVEAGQSVESGAVLVVIE
jgi:biotin carboxyl carrier protein